MGIEPPQATSIVFTGRRCTTGPQKPLKIFYLRVINQYSTNTVAPLYHYLYTHIYDNTVVAQWHKCSTVNGKVSRRTVVGSIPTRGNEIFNIFISSLW